MNRQLAIGSYREAIAAFNRLVAKYKIDPQSGLAMEFYNAMAELADELDTDDD